ncbi:hypothetical protein RIF29_17030 [Crotalaria pallida]|uniref:Cytochrome P450 n=1 Tax=Crotalaria pallida TaxID=3830 RepID=A0AAN9IEZ1_CROPI
MEELFVAMKMASSVILFGILSWILYVCVNKWYESERIRRKLINQGISGPPPFFLRGNLPDMQRIRAKVSDTIKAPSSCNNSSDKFLAHDDHIATIFPYFEHWRKQYGRLYTYSTGMKHHLSWQGMVDLIVKSAQPLLTKWEECIEAQGGGNGIAEVTVDADLRGFSANVISMVCFGHSYSKGKEIFEKIRTLKDAIANSGYLFGISSFRYYAVNFVLKVTMVIQEVLRLYPPGVFVAREAYEDVQIGNLHVPKGVNIWTLVPTLHRDPEIWGPDANKFKPERFKDGVSKACKFPQSYAPFGLGARLCVGKNLGMMELKIVLALIISKFNLSLSPCYKHSPAFKILVEPEHGVQLLIQKI